MILKADDRLPTMWRGVISFSKSLLKYFNINDQDDPIIFLKHHKTLLEKIKVDFLTVDGRQFFSGFNPIYIGPEIADMDQAGFSFLGIKISTNYLEKYNGGGIHLTCVYSICRLLNNEKLPQNYYGNFKTEEACRDANRWMFLMI